MNKISLSDSGKDTLLELFENLQVKRELIFATMRQLTTDATNTNIALTSLMKVFVETDKTQINVAMILAAKYGAKDYDDIYKMNDERTKIKDNE